jgi:hypothetical protein
MIKQDGSATFDHQLANNHVARVVSEDWYKCGNGHTRYFMDGEIPPRRKGPVGEGL